LVEQRMKLKPIAKGISTFVPGLRNFRAKGTRGTDSARYCYTVWARHLIMAAASGLSPSPRVVAELGPGDSLGIGIAALISGSERYLAFDVVEHASPERNNKILDELIALFRTRAALPGDDEFPNVKPRLSDYRFPHDIFTDARLAASMAPERLDQIRASLTNPSSTQSMIVYKVPWSNPQVIEAEVADLIFSQAVLEHVDDLDGAYAAMRTWLKPNGFVSHQIDFRCHKTADRWNGHWSYSDFLWKLIRGRRSYLLNRQPYSTHERLLRQHGFQLLRAVKSTSDNGVARSQLAKRFAAMSDDDFITSGVFVQATKCGSFGASTASSTI
jgi:hypothetical protein